MKCPRIFNQRGQVVVLFAVIFPLLVLLLAFFVNMGLLIHQKIRLQNAVDAGVYSASASLARDLDSIAQRNQDIKNMFDGDPSGNEFCKDFTHGDKSYIHIIENTLFNSTLDTHETLYNDYQNAYHECVDQMDTINESAYANAIGAGATAALRTFYNGVENLVATNPLGLQFGYYRDLPPDNPDQALDQQGEDKMFDIKETIVTKGMCLAKTQESGNNFFDPYEGKDCDLEKQVNRPVYKLDTTQFVGHARAPVGFTNLLANLFRVANTAIDSSNGQIQLNTYAAGQPTSGSIEGRLDTYRATLIPISKIKEGAPANVGH